jgi:DnaJ-class molecular chaperone
MILRFHYSLYNVLGVTKQASTQEIKDAYLKLAKMHHPDVSESKHFKDISNAYNILKDPIQKNIYDQTHGIRVTPSKSESRQQRKYTYEETSHEEKPFHGTYERSYHSQQKPYYIVVSLLHR